MAPGQQFGTKFQREVLLLLETPELSCNADGSLGERKISDRTHVCDGRTDRQTDTWPMTTAHTALAYSRVG